MLDCERWTLTHSSGWAGGLVLAVALALALTLASSDADAELVSEGEGELDAEVESDGDGGALVALVCDALGEGDGEGEGLGDGVGVGVGDGVGVGVGEGELDGGSTWHVVLVFAFALVEVPGLDVAEARLSPPAQAEPARPASTTRARKHPASTLSAVTRTCVKRIKSPCLRCLSGLLSARRGFGGD